MNLTVQDLLAIATEAKLSLDQGEQAAEFVVAAKTQLPPDVIQALSKMAQGDDGNRQVKQSRQALNQLWQAMESVRTDPIAYSARLRLLIQQMDLQAYADPEMVTRLVLDTISTEPFGGKDAFPLFVRKQTSESARWRGLQLFLPDVTTEKWGAYAVRGLGMFVPTWPERDTETMQKLKQLRKVAALQLVSDLDDPLVNPRDAVWQALHLIEGYKSIWTPMMFDSAERKEGKTLHRGKPVVTVKLSSTEYFVTEATELGNGFAEKLQALLDQVVGEQSLITMNEILCNNQDLVITPEEFLRGRSGIVALSNDAWRLGGKEEGKEPTLVETWSLLQRSDKGWRPVCVKDPRHLFSGQTLDWQNTPLPPHLVAFIKRGMPLAPNFGEDETNETQVELVEDEGKAASYAESSPMAPKALQAKKREPGPKKGKSSKKLRLKDTRTKINLADIRSQETTT